MPTIADDIINKSRKSPRLAECIRCALYDICSNHELICDIAEKATLDNKPFKAKYPVEL